MNFTTRRMDGSEQMLSEALSAIRRPDGYGVTTLDLQAAEEFRAARSAQTGVELTLLDLFIRGAALVAGKDARVNSLVHGRKVASFQSVDVGISVAATTAVAPVVVVRAAETKSLEQIHEERVRLVREAVAGEGARRKELESKARLVPIPALRRRVVGWLVNQPQFRREQAGTLQITSIDLPDMDFYLPAHLTTSLLLSFGGVKPMAFVVDGKVEVRLGAQVAIMIDQRVIHPVHGMRLFRRFRRYLENPERLIK